MLRIAIAFISVLWATLAVAQVPPTTKSCDGTVSGCPLVGLNNAQVVTGNTTVPTYSATLHNFSNSSAGDLYCISGSSTKTIKVKGIRVSAIASQAVNSSISIVRRSTLDTGGTPTLVTPVPSDTNNPAATAVVTGYGTAPTTGTLVGRVRAQKLSIGTTANNTLSPAPALFQFTVYWDQSQVLRGVNQALCVDVDSTTGGTWEVDSEFTEE